MKLRLAAIIAFAAATFAASSASAAAYVRVGILKCSVAPSIGYVVASERHMRCYFTPTYGGRIQTYYGTAGRIGLDLGVTHEGVLVWAVFAPTRHISRHDLAGTYAGVSAGAAVGAGIGANALLGGSQNTIALQPLSGEGSVGLSVALGVTALQLY